MLKGKTESGFEFELEDEVLDDWEILECFRNIDKGKTEYIIDAAEMLLGEAQYKRLKSFIKERYGRIKASIMATEVANIFGATKEGKNC